MTCALLVSQGARRRDFSKVSKVLCCCQTADKTGIKPECALIQLSNFAAVPTVWFSVWRCCLVTDLFLVSLSKA